ncbi:hypothetical protein M3686_11210 [Micrococcus luteus]|uniref:hypothetical protein n=1 Tax=Micrococcus luteus TaxID=1270 RepID=UPI00203E7D5F|nr:hypothetical protein [Micrococcus luteus]MCM3578688.1 hypothetical protein [Micrococcus luteus]
MQTIENARLDDVLPGDHLTWEDTWERRSVTRTVRREGIAAYQRPSGDWDAADGMNITCGEGEGITLTIRRTVQPRPAEYDGAVLIPAEGRKSITTTDGQEFARLTFTTKQSIWYGPNLAALPGDLLIQATSPSRLTPGTWKEAGQ